MIPISPRLLCCASMIEGDYVCDIGTDHAYLPAYLISGGTAKTVIATDVKQGPLNSAAGTLKRFHVSDHIRLILSDGFDKVPPKHITDVVIAGMGGETIRDILAAKSAQFLKKGVNLVLQPMTKAEILRAWLSENGYAILKETAVRDTHVYTVMQVQYTGECKEISEAEAFFGKLRRSDPLTKIYIAAVLERLNTKASGLEEAGKTDEAAAVRTTMREINARLHPQKGETL